MPQQHSAKGSTWHHWDPHIHVPGTALNDQYGNATITEFCQAVDKADPPIAALGVTDYFSIRGYEAVVAAKAGGNLSNTALIFPNVEIRLGLSTKGGSAINAHLLFSPDDEDHVQEIKRLLSRLTFRFLDEDYSATDEDLRQLGRKFNPKLPSDDLAYKEGVNQFKVDLNALVRLLEGSEWARKNCLLAIAVGQGDGSSGLRSADNQFSATRTTLEASADIIFSSNPNDRLFWLGKGPDSIEQLELKYRGTKPCLHGSDAHQLQDVGLPDQGRLCWLKGDPCFETLIQACIEPELRVHIGAEPPLGALGGSTMESIRVTEAPWIHPSQIPINPGLVAIIGARGSGKTALADLIAAGALGLPSEISRKSFLLRAYEFLGKSRAQAQWGSGETTSTDLRSIPTYGAPSLPRAQYLSQQFVDDLCSADGMTDSLLREIKRVIFSAHPRETREGAADFDELYEMRCAPILESRIRWESELSSISKAELEERMLRQEVKSLQDRKLELLNRIEKDSADQKSLIRTGQEERLKQQEEIASALRGQTARLEALQSQLRAQRALIMDLTDFRDRVAGSLLQEMRSKREDAGLSETEWANLLPKIAPEADNLVVAKITESSAQIAAIAGEPIDNEEVPEHPPIADGAALEEQTVSALQAESDRLSNLIGIDAASAKRHRELGERIQATTREITNLDKRIARCNEAEHHLTELRKRRKEAYSKVFECIEQLEAELKNLYSPLETSLAESGGLLRRLKLSVRRTVNITAWADTGEDLLDLRKDGLYRGKGALEAAAREKLLIPWSSGTAKDVSEAVSKFIDENAESIKVHKLDTMDGREWNASIYAWLYSPTHIDVTYAPEYDGLDVKTLSPGTRGIVLLLLYLTVDKEDDRPLIIDQPEENLDPQSVYDELVNRFRAAKSRRQIVIVTHNANLVVNTDADQVIIASAGKQSPGELPRIDYFSGGLENPLIRQKVCSILEGGERAFRDRAKRLRLASLMSPTTH